MTKAEIYKIRYQLYRDLGYTPDDARKLRSRPLFKVEQETKVKKVKNKEEEVVDFKIEKVSKNEFENLVKINKKTGKVVKGKVYRNIRDSITAPKDVEKFKNKAYRVKNDTVYSRWGMLTQDERYRDNTAKIVKFLEKEHGLNNDQAYYLLYYITTHKISYATARRELLTRQDFEEYIPKGRRK